MMELLKRFVVATIVLAGMIFLNLRDFKEDRERYEARKAEMLQCDQEEMNMGFDC